MLYNQNLGRFSGWSMIFYLLDTFQGKKGRLKRQSPFKVISPLSFERGGEIKG